jgi:hypothetical protein
VRVVAQTDRDEAGRIRGNGVSHKASAASLEA